MPAGHGADSSTSGGPTTLRDETLNTSTRMALAPQQRMKTRESSRRTASIVPAAIGIGYEPSTTWRRASMTVRVGDPPEVGAVFDTYTCAPSGAIAISTGVVAAGSGSRVTTWSVSASITKTVGVGHATGRQASEATAA